ncbi:MAG: Cation diffusion facilitator family transporter [Verrucomicrobiales bacterium]|nr:Cation diffusion facilitator family transporter [Verrucomicrobiales bacterium]
MKAEIARGRLKRSLRVTFIGLLMNTVLAAGKLVAGLLGHSHALVADAVESMADLFSSVIVWRGLVVAAEPEDEDHPYGHGKAEPIAGALVATMLIFASVWIGFQAVTGLLNPHGGPAPFTLAVLIIVILVKELLFRYARLAGAEMENTAVSTDAWHHRSDAITSFAAGIGISVSLIGGEKYARADDVAAFVAAGIIAWNGVTLIRPALNELMDASPETEVTERVRASAREIEGVQNIEKCLVRKMGYVYFVDMHVEVDPKMTVENAHQIAHAVKDRVRKNIPRVRDVLVHIEPAKAPLLARH